MPAKVGEKYVLLSGSFGTCSNSARAGFLPIALARAPMGAFEGIPIYLRTRGGDDPTIAAVKGINHDPHHDAFTLFSAEHVRFTELHRDRLAKAGVKFVYIPIAQQGKFRGQTEARLQEIAADPSIAISVRSEI